MPKIKNNTTHSRLYIINTLYEDFNGLVSDDVIEHSLIKLGLISSVTRDWLKEHFIEKELSAKECSDLVGCSLGHIQNQIKKYKLEKKRFGITAGNNKVQRRSKWKQKIQNSQPNRKEVVVFHADNDEPLFLCPSIVATARKLQVAREHVRDCLNYKKQRNTLTDSSGIKFKFMFKKAYDELIKKPKKLSNGSIDFNSSLEDIVSFFKTIEE